MDTDHWVQNIEERILTYSRIIYAAVTTFLKSDLFHPRHLPEVLVQSVSSRLLPRLIDSEALGLGPGSACSTRFPGVQYAHEADHLCDSQWAVRLGNAGK